MFSSVSRTAIRGSARLAIPARPVALGEFLFWCLLSGQQVSPYSNTRVQCSPTYITVLVLALTSGVALALALAGARARACA
jgi:hypothetical protein